MYNNLPKRLKENGSFCLWKYEQRGEGKATKMPYQTNGIKAQSNNKQTFTSFDNVIKEVNNYNGIGVGIFDGLCAIDIDHCIDQNGKLSPLAYDICSIFKLFYVEVSPSKQGIRILFLTNGFNYDKTKYYVNNANLGLEIYVSGATNKYVTVTGNVLHKANLLYNVTELQTVLDKYMLKDNPITKNQKTTCKSYLSDDEVINKASSCQNYIKFKSLWNGEVPINSSHSEADFALCNILAFWCGKDIQQMDRLFRKSGLMRDKWNRVQSGSTYGKIVLEKASSSVSSTYSPTDKPSPKDELEPLNSDYINSDLDSEPNCDLAKEYGINLMDFKPFTNEKYQCNDIGNSNLFADCFKDIARFVPERKQWFVFDGKVWVADTGSLKVMNLCKALANDIMNYVLLIKDENLRRNYIDFAKKWQSRRVREIILRDAGDIYPVKVGQFDNDIYLLNCQNGTLNLKTNHFYKHNPNDFITKLAGVNYNPNASCSRWESFINEVMSGDSDKADFLQKSLGYALTGDTSLEAMFILYGATTRNGKGTTMETFLKICGDYGKTARPEMIGLKIINNSNTPSEDVARLMGSRFVNISEPDKKLTLSSSLLKTLTGNDTINARFLHENSFDFKPQFKIFINTNHLPTVNDLTLLTSGRVKIIPFSRHFEECEQDKTLKTEFSKPENLSGILNWVIKGYNNLAKNGLKVPISVELATLSYKQENDKVGQFIEECLEQNLTSEERTADIYLAYQSWCKENGYFCENTRNFKSSLAGIGTIVKKRPKNGGNTTNILQGYSLVKYD